MQHSDDRPILTIVSHSRINGNLEGIIDSMTFSKEEKIGDTSPNAPKCTIVEAVVILMLEKAIMIRCSSNEIKN